MQCLEGECEVRIGASAPRPISKIQEYVRYQARHHPSEVIPGWPVKRLDEQDRPDPRISPANSLSLVLWVVIAVTCSPQTTEDPEIFGQDRRDMIM